MLLIAGFHELTAPDEETSKASLKRPIDEVKQTKACEKIGFENKKNEIDLEENKIGKLIKWE